MNQPRNTQPSQERNLRDRSSLDTENVPDPVSFNEEGQEAESMIEDEDLDRVERDQPKAGDADDIKDR